MKNDYPYLAAWKETGLDQFPPIPFEIIFDKTFPEGIRAGTLKELSKKTFSGTPGDSIIGKTLKEYDQTILQDVYEMRRRVELGESKKQLWKEFNRKYLPNRRGGKIFTDPVKMNILKSLYLEIQDCVKAIRYEFGISLKDPEPDLLQWNLNEEIKEYLPEIAELFTDKELQDLTKYSKADAAIKILCDRLDDRYQISQNTLRNNLAKTPPFEETI